MVYLIVGEFLLIWVSRAYGFEILKKCGEALKLAVNRMDVDDVNFEAGCLENLASILYFSELGCSKNYLITQITNKMTNNINHHKTDILQKPSLTSSRYDCYSISPLPGLANRISAGLGVSIRKDDLDGTLFSVYSTLFFSC